MNRISELGHGKRRKCRTTGRRFRACALVAILLALCPHFAGRLDAQTNQIWPEIDTYIRLNPNSRLFFSVQNTREEAASTEVDIGAHVDLFLKPIRKKYLLSSSPKDEAKSQWVLFRVGYHYLFPNDNPDAAENRVIVEVTPRIPGPFGIVVADRHRADLRFLQDGFAWRYRNRVSIERTFHVGRYSFDSYMRAEVWFDSLYQKWSRTLFQAGAEFPIRKHVSFESYYEHQNNTSKAPNHSLNGVGVILNLRF